MGRVTATKKPYQKGDFVKLTDRYAEVLSRSKGGNRTLWKGRRGVVRSCNDTAVGVLWDGRSSTEWVPLGGVERFVADGSVPTSTKSTMS